MSNKTLVLALSGGLDSTTLCATLLSARYDVRPIIFEYNSKHNPYEVRAALDICKHYDLSPRIINTREIFMHFESDLLETGGEIPEGHYNDENMKRTVVPGRNMIFASILTGYALSVNAGRVALGVHQGDHHIYPDCRPPFIESLGETIYRISEGRCGLMTPFLEMAKDQIVGLGNDLDVPFKLTRTCYKDQLIPCGKCGSCVERLEAFEMCYLEDPVTYEGEV